MNNEIEVGEYVRTNWGISKILANYGQYFIVDKNGKQMISSFNEYIDKEDIVNHSKNIIDLIEVGDYVNGSKVLEIMEDMNTGEIHLEMPMDYTNEEIGDCTIYNKDIKSIVTKEQYKSVEYVF